MLWLSWRRPRHRRPVTRGEAAVFLWRMEGAPTAPPHPFTDVVLDWQQGAVSWLSAEGITTGTTAETYSPDDTLTRGQFAALLHRLDGGSTGAPDPVSYTHLRAHET